jgi:hypothetical protein
MLKLGDSRALQEEGHCWLEIEKRNNELGDKE